MKIWTIRMGHGDLLFFLWVQMDLRHMMHFFVRDTVHLHHLL